ncbi:hypothetical protein LINGRAHAP2_LOCUS24108 [Linum grandiflorum]
MTTPRRSFSMTNHDLINIIHGNHIVGFAPPPPPFYSSYPPPAAAPPLLPFPVSIPRHTSLPNYNYQTTPPRKPANRPRKHKTKSKPRPAAAAAAAVPVGPEVSSYPAGKVGHNEIPVISLAADDLFISLLAPPPSSLPLPKFFIGRPKRAQGLRSCTVEAAAVSGGNDEGAVDNLRRLLRLP